jgi:hypothetical protein
MTAEDAIRFLHFEASWCRAKNEAEAFCLLLPPILNALDLSAMNGYEAELVRRELRQRVNGEFSFAGGGRVACRNLT